LAAIIQSIATLIIGSVIGLVYFWQVGLVAIGEFPCLCFRPYLKHLISLYTYLGIDWIYSFGKFLST